MHLYNKEKEGIGNYDINYINAFKKKELITVMKIEDTNQRYAA